MVTRRFKVQPPEGPKPPARPPPPPPQATSGARPPPPPAPAAPSKPTREPTGRFRPLDASGKPRSIDASAKKSADASGRHGPLRADAEPAAKSPGGGRTLHAEPIAPRSALLGGQRIDPKSDLARLAMRLRDEQMRAKVVYFGADQQTNAELDAITEAVVAELQAIQAAGVAATASRRDTDIEAELAKTLKGFLDKLLSNRRKVFVKRKIEEVQRRISALFFGSELGARAREQGADPDEITWSDQALFYALRRHVPAIVADLYALRYADPRVRDDAVERLNRFEKALRVEFLSRTTPELETLLQLFREALGAFLRQFRKDLPEFTMAVVRESGVAPRCETGYKIPAEAFAPFRAAFEKRFVEALVDALQDEVLQRVPATRESFRDPTLRFMVDPHVYSEICAVVCDACYDYLHVEGFLDLPADWRAHVATD